MMTDDNMLNKRRRCHYSNIAGSIGISSVGGIACIRWNNQNGKEEWNEV